MIVFLGDDSSQGCVIYNLLIYSRQTLRLSHSLDLLHIFTGVYHVVVCAQRHESREACNVESFTMSKVIVTILDCIACK